MLPEMNVLNFNLTTRPLFGSEAAEQKILRQHVNVSKRLTYSSERSIRLLESVVIMLYRMAKEVEPCNTNIHTLSYAVTLRRRLPLENM